MALTFTKVALSGASNGLAVKVAATATAGTLIHTAVTGTASFDEIWLWAYNSDTVSRLLTVEYGGATAPDNNIAVTVPSKSGLMLVVPGLILQNSLTVKAFAAAANVVTLSGYVNRMA
mgnify:CR=1 FL=1